MQAGAGEVKNQIQSSLPLKFTPLRHSISSAQMGTHLSNSLVEEFGPYLVRVYTGNDVVRFSVSRKSF